MHEQRRRKEPFKWLSSDDRIWLSFIDRSQKPFLRFLWLTGCRPSEALTLQVEMVEEASSIAILKEHKTAKATGKPRFIYLSAESLGLLQEQRQRHGLGFMFRNGNGKPYSLNNAVNILWRLNKKLGTKATLYGFRHSYATEGLAKGLPEAHVAELLGHCSTKMLHAHYSHLGAKANIMREAANKVRASA
jgi:integrase